MARVRGALGRTAITKNSLTTTNAATTAWEIRRKSVGPRCKKWMSNDGLSIWVEYNAYNGSVYTAYESLNLIEGTMTLTSGSSVADLLNDWNAAAASSVLHAWVWARPVDDWHPADAPWCLTARMQG